MKLYPRHLFVKMLVKPLLLTLNACTAYATEEDQVQRRARDRLASRQAVPVIVAVLSWFHAMAEEAKLADPADFYSDGVSKLNVERLFEDLYNMKHSNPEERSKNFYLCSHPFLLVSVCRQSSSSSLSRKDLLLSLINVQSPICKRNLLQMESQIEVSITCLFGCYLSCGNSTVSSHFLRNQ